ncbi:MAG: hypothetical protein M5U25_11345 [Planctomycetota bacterium]|nr:hypothetical protein [Planctomycetota bacterium]
MTISSNSLSPSSKPRHPARQSTGATQALGDAHQRNAARTDQGRAPRNKRKLKLCPQCGLDMSESTIRNVEANVLVQGEPVRLYDQGVQVVIVLPPVPPVPPANLKPTPPQRKEDPRCSTRNT